MERDSDKMNLRSNDEPFQIQRKRNEFFVLFLVGLSTLWIVIFGDFKSRLIAENEHDAIRERQLRVRMLELRIGYLDLENEVLKRENERLESRIRELEGETPEPE